MLAGLPDRGAEECERRGPLLFHVKLAPVGRAPTRFSVASIPSSRRRQTGSAPGKIALGAGVRRSMVAFWFRSSKGIVDPPEYAAEQFPRSVLELLALPALRLQLMRQRHRGEEHCLSGLRLSSRRNFGNLRIHQSGQSAKILLGG